MSAWVKTLRFLRYFGRGKTVRPAPERHGLFFELWDALEKDECAVCRLIRKRQRVFVESLFFEGVCDPKLRRQVVEAIGFSPPTLALCTEQKDALGLSILYDSVCTAVCWDLERDRAAEPSAPCPVRRYGRAVERDLTATFAAHYPEADFRRRHRDSKGLCLTHLNQVSARLRDSNLRRELRDSEVEKIRVIQEELRLYIAKNDYQDNRPIGSESEAWARAVRKLAPDWPAE